MKHAAILLTVLLLGGCVTDGQTETGAAGAAGSTRAESAAYEKRQRCQSTSIGSQPQTICY